MCGITGQFHFRAEAPVDRAKLERMTRVLKHRGPDDEGFYFSPNRSFGLGFRRLSILDLSPAGHQPMSDPEGRFWLAFNGEIYNFREIRAELEGLGYVFRSQTDTEVIVLGFRQWGEGILGKLNGMFGLALWDEQERRLVLARDATGIKPLYYCLANGTLTFGSEIRAVLAGLDHRPGVDALGIRLFLEYRYTPAPYTALDGISKLAPGEMLVVEHGKAITRRWYEFVPTPFERQPSDREATEKLLELYRAAVKRHLVSDVPVGLLLSGGIDSGLLLGLMSECGSDWPTYTVGYGSSFKDDELEDAAATATHYGARNTAVRIDRATFEETLPSIVDTLEEPIASSSIVPMHFVCQRAREDVTVALIGQGPDELFGGYARHLGVAYGALWRKLPGPLRALITAGIRSLPRSETLKRGVQSLGTSDRLSRYRQVFSLSPSASINRLFHPDCRLSDPDEAVLRCWEAHRRPIEGLDELGGFQLLELRSSLADELLMYGDKISMAHSLEARVPYLDREVVEYSQRLVARFKVRNGQRKWLHRRVCRSYLPDSIIRRKKRGFAVNVVDDWFRGSLQGRLQDLLSDPASRLYSFLDAQQVNTLQAEHQAGRADHHKLLFSVTLLAEWLESVQSVSPPNERSGSGAPAAIQ